MVFLEHIEEVLRPDPFGRGQEVELREGQIEGDERRPQREPEEADEPGQEEQVPDLVLLPPGTPAHQRSRALGWLDDARHASGPTQDG